MATAHLDPEAARKINDLRRKILENEEKGLPAHHGISKEDLEKALAHLRQNRTAAMEASGKKKATTKTKGASAPVPDLNDLLSSLTKK